MDTTMPWLWAPALAFGNLFAAFWLLRMLLVAYPASRWWTRLTGKKSSADGPIRLSEHHSSSGCEEQPNGTPQTSNAHSQDSDPSAESDQSPAEERHGAEAPLPEAIRRASRTLIEPVMLQWRDIGCTYQIGSQSHVVLAGVTGRARPGGLHALLGPSGAGKSSLLDILAQRKRVGKLTGQVLMNGRQVSRKALVSRSAYVPQDDNFMPILTAHETLGFYASLLLPPTVSDHARTARAHEVLAVLGLAHCHNTLVGGQLPGGMTLRGLSGGERKRLALSVGLLAAPSLLFLDEPTSGLDSFAALTVIRYIRAMASEANHVVIASIHQPRSAIWNMFDEVTVLSRGMMMFSGPCDRMVHWFTQDLPLALQDQDHTPKQPGTQVVLTIQATPSNHINDEPCDSSSSSQGNHPAAQRAGASGAAYTGGPGTSCDVAKDCRMAAVVYVPEVHGVPSDWVLDVVSLGFGGPQAGTQAGGKKPGQGDEEAAECGFLSTVEQLHAAAAAFARHQPTYHAQATARPLRPNADPSPSAPQTQATGAVANSPAVAPPHIHCQGLAFNDQVVARSQTQMAPLALRTESVTAALSLRRHSASTSHTTVDDDWHEAALAQQLEALYGAPQPGRELDPVHVAEGGRPETSSPCNGVPAGSDCAVSAQATGSSAGLTPTLSNASSCHRDGGKEEPFPSNLGAKACPFHAHAAPSGNPTIVALVNGRPHRTPRLLGVRLKLLRAWVHLRALLWRETMAITRNPADVAGRMLTFSWIAVFAGLVFYNLPNDLASAQLRLNVQFANTAFVLLMPYTSMSLYTADRQYWLADSSSRLYSPSSYYIAKVVATVPFHVLCATVYTLVAVGMTGLRRGVQPIVQMTVITATTSLIAVQVLHAASTLATNQDMAFMIALLWTALNLLLSGFFITYKQFAFPGLSQLRWLSAQAYAFEGLANVELQGIVYNCSEGLGARELDVLPALLPNTQQLQSPLVLAMLNQPGQTCEARADAVLQYFDLSRGFKATFGILVAYWGVMHLITYAALLLASRQEKR